MSSLAIEQHRKYSYADYLKFDNNERWELLEGNPISMAPAPNKRHQEAVGNLFTMMKNHLKGTKYKAFVAPFDVRLYENDKAEDSLIYNVIQPDIVVYCDDNKLDDRGGVGAPDVIVEVLSPATAEKDQTTKLKLYERAGVKEYIIVHPEDRLVYLRTLADDNLFSKPLILGRKDKLVCRALNNLTIEVAEIFEE